MTDARHPDWELEPVPCLGGGCTPESPTCERCLAAIAAMLKDGIDPDRWPGLAEWMREAWRREALDG